MRGFQEDASLWFQALDQTRLIIRQRMLWNVSERKEFDDEKEGRKFYGKTNRGNHYSGRHTI
jgi:hypothetical protein